MSKGIYLPNFSKKRETILDDIKNSYKKKGNYVGFDTTG